MINPKDIKAGMVLGHADAVLIQEALQKLAELKKQRDALAAENAVLKLAIETHKHGFMRCECCGEENMCHNDDVCRALDETPATDAYLNSVRAAAVNHAGKMIFATMNHQDKGVERALECIAEVELQYTLAAQLRAGEPS